MAFAKEPVCHVRLPTRQSQCHGPTAMQPSALPAAQPCGQDPAPVRVMAALLPDKVPDQYEAVHVQDWLHAAALRVSGKSLSIEHLNLSRSQLLGCLSERARVPERK